MFKDLGIKGRVLLLTLLPTSLLAMVLGGYFTWVQLSDMRAQLIERGQLIAEQLAPLAATALARKDTAVLNRIANEALDQPDVRAVTFLDARQERLAHAGPSMLTVAPAGDASHLSMSTELDTTHFLLPVLGRHHSLSGATEPDDERVLGWVELELSHHGTLLRGYRSLFTSLLLIAAGLGVTALLALRMSRAINAPLELISQGVAQLKEGRMETRLPPMGSNELDELASGINRMAETLQSAQEEMQHNIDQATEDVRQNLETIEIQNIELDLARKEALEASRIKSEFLANMSHEIRTPLNGILGFTNLLQKSELSPRQQDYLTTIQKSAESLLGIINEILDFSKIEAGKLVLENLPFNLRDLIQDALTMLAPAAHEKQLELVSLVYRDTPIQLQGDPQRLKQILTNLVGNAIKFTQGGTVAVRAMLEDESDDRAQLRISVQDTGIGLSEEDQQALFKAFSQADNSLSRQAGGTGLGLVISKRLIEQMGGEIGVDSTPGEGAEFWISLSLPKSRDDNEEPGASWAAGQRVALLEPQELTRRSLHHQLTDFGLEVSEFADLDSLQESLRNPPPGQLPISLAVLGVSAAIHPPEELSQSFWEFERLGCKTLVLCPTTEQAQYHATLPDEQVEAKPACTRKLQRKLQEFQPRLQRTLTMRILFFSSQAYDSESFQASNHRHGFELHFQQAHLQADTAVLAQGFEVVCAFVNDDLSRPVLERLAAGGTRLVALRSAGYNHVDLAAAEALGLPVVHVPAYSPHAVAEHAVGLILTLNRRLHRAYNRTREGDFSLHGLTGFDLHGKRVGVIGTGQIGETFARIMAGFGCELLAYDPYPNPRIQALGGRYLALDALLAESDIVSLHCPLTADTRHLIDAQRLATMKPGAMLINTGRGALVNAAALIEALKSGQLGYLGLDVYEEEADIFFEDRSDQPLQDDVLARLLSFPNVVVTAHQAFLTREALAAIADTTLDNIAAWQDGTPRNRVRA